MHVGDNTLRSIGEIARKTGLLVKLIRHWSDDRVVHPARRTPADYRLYGTKALARLQLAQTLGVYRLTGNVHRATAHASR